MSSDRPTLPAALAQIADGAGAAHAARDRAGDGLPVARIHTAARRRRARFGAGVAVAAAVVVSALVLGGSAVGRLIDREPVPPIRTPDPAGWDVDYSRCGQTLESMGWQTSTAPPVLSVALPQADSEAMVTFLAGVMSPAGDSHVRPSAVGTRRDAVVLGGDTVVGVLGTTLAESGPDELVPVTEQDTDRLLFTMTAPAFSCATRDGSTRLEPGQYTLVAAQRVLIEQVDGTDVEKLVVGRSLLTVAEPPVPDDPEARPAHALRGTVPECGAPLDNPVTGDAVGHMRLEFSDPLDLEGGGLVQATATVANDVAAAADVDLAVGLRVLVTRNQIVVARAGIDTFQVHSTDGRGTLPLRHGTARTFRGLLVVPCADGVTDADPGLLPGDYDAWVLVPLADDAATTLIAGPWPYTIDAVR